MQTRLGPSTSDHRYALTLNGGSSSLKFGIFDLGGRTVSSAEEPTGSGARAPPSKQKA